MGEGMTCDGCGTLVRLLINCKGCIYVVCRPCYEQKHSRHHLGPPTIIVAAHPGH
jgi:hypothetical protein